MLITPCTDAWARDKASVSIVLSRIKLMRIKLIGSNSSACIFFDLYSIARRP